MRFMEHFDISTFGVINNFAFMTTKKIHNVYCVQSSSEDVSQNFVYNLLNRLVCQSMIES